MGFPAVWVLFGGVAFGVLERVVWWADRPFEDGRRGSAGCLGVLLGLAAFWAAVAWAATR